MVMLGLPYGEATLPGFWGEINSQANFCEEDYIITQYIAEFINTLTNFIYIIYAFYGIYKNSGRKDAYLRNMSYLGILAVGVGSGLFHATNKYYTQMADDLSMLIAVATVFHRVYTFESSATTTVVSGIVLWTTLIAFAIWHCVTDEIVMHSLIFGIMTSLVGIQTRSVIARRITDPAIKKDIMRVLGWGGIIFVSGYGIWNLDNAFCTSLTHAKHTIGMPWSFLLELHGWWHLFTGVGAYTFIALVEYLTSEEAGEPLEGRFAWPLNLIVQGSSPSSKAAIPNGNAGKAKTKVIGHGITVQESRNGKRDN